MWWLFSYSANNIVNIRMVCDLNNNRHYTYIKTWDATLCCDSEHKPFEMADVLFKARSLHEGPYTCMTGWRRRSVQSCG